MSSRFLRRNGRKLGVAAITASLGLSGLALSASPANALPNFEFERLAGDDRIETAVDISANTFTSSASALIARADLYPDALAGNYLAGAQQDPILLSHTDELPAETMAELDRLGATSVTILGGTDAISADVEAALEAEGLTVNREAGTDRYKTAADIATSQPAATIGTVAGKRTAILATGQNFPDALTGGPLSYAGKHPILLTPTAALGADAAGALDSLDIQHVIILGGTSAVSPAAETAVQAMGITTQRLAGNTRYDTATKIADFALTQGFSNSHVDVATGLNFPDALTGGPHAGQNRSPILLANDGNTAEAVAWLQAHAGTLADGHIFGGTAAVSAAVEATLEAAARAQTTNQAFAATPATATVQSVNTVRQFSVSNLGTAPVAITLFECADVAVDQNGVATFRGTNPGGTGNVAQIGTLPAGSNISVINGAVQTGTATSRVATPSNGTVTFSVTTTGPGCVVPVIWRDADADQRLDLGANNQPTEAFGVAGETTFIPAEAETGAFDGTVTSALLAIDAFTVGANTYNYDVNDVFQVWNPVTEVGQVVSMADFEARLSNDDVIREGSFYQSEPGASSVFILDDLGPLAPDAPTTRQPELAANVGKAGIEVVFDDSATTTVASYQVLRATLQRPTVIGAPAPTCPTAEAAYTQVGTVQNVVNQASYVFFDSTATPPTAPETDYPQYCYRIRAVDQTGDVGPASASSAPAEAFPASTASTMGFAAADSNIVDGNTVQVGYNNTVNAATVAPNGSDFRVTATAGGVSTNIPVLSAARDAADDSVVIIQLAADIPEGTVVTVTSQTGADGNTVCAGTATTNCQPAGQTVQLGAAPEPA